MPSPTQWTWAWASSRSWWWTEKPGMLQSMGSQRVRLDWATELMHETIKLPSNPGYSQVHYFHLQPRAQAKATRVFKHSSKAPPPPLLLTPHPLLYSLFTVGTELCAQKSELCQDALGWGWGEQPANHREGTKQGSWVSRLPSLQLASQLIRDEPVQPWDLAIAAEKRTPGWAGEESGVGALSLCCGNFSPNREYILERQPRNITNSSTPAPLSNCSAPKAHCRAS